MSDDVPFDPPPLDDLRQGALECLERHFAAINSGDREAFRETAYLFEANDGLPFERWWSGMRSLAPLSVALTPGRADATVHAEHEPHLGIWVHAAAHSAATAVDYAGDFVVWYLVGSRRWKVGCRLHWWLRLRIARDPPGAYLDARAKRGRP